MFTQKDFAAWRAKDAQNELETYGRAAGMARLVRSANNLKQIQDTLVDKDSKAYTDFTAPQGGRIFSIMVFVKLTTMVALNKQVFADVDQPALELVHKALADLYVNYNSNLKPNFNTLLDNLTSITRLNEQSEIAELNKPKNLIAAKTYFLSIYFALKMIYIYINKSDSAKTFFLDFNKLSVAELNSSIETLLPAIENYVNQLELEIQKKGANPLAANEQSLHSQLEARLLLDSQVLISGLNGTVANQLSILSDTIIENEARLNALIETKKKIAVQKKNIKAYTDLLTAINGNDQLVTGRKYILELIEANTQNYQTLIDNTPVTNQAFLTQLARVQNPTTYQGVVVNSLSFLSQGTHRLVAEYRKLASTKVQEVVNSIMPATLDSSCKTLLKNLTKTTLLEAELKLDALEEELKKQEEAFAAKDIPLHLVEEASTENLEQLYIELNKVEQLTTDFVNLSDSLRDAAEHLGLLQQDCKVLAEYLKNNDTIFIKILSFLAQCFSIFRTEMVELVEQAKLKQTELSVLITEQQEQMETHLHSDQNQQHAIIKEWVPLCQQEMDTRQQAVAASTRSVKDVIAMHYSLFAVNATFTTSQPGSDYTTIDTNSLTQ